MQYLEAFAQMAIRKFRFTRYSYNAPVMPFFTTVLIKEPPSILTLENWNIVGFKGGLKDFVAVVPV